MTVIYKRIFLIHVVNNYLIFDRQGRINACYFLKYTQCINRLMHVGGPTPKDDEFTGVL